MRIFHHISCTFGLLSHMQNLGFLFSKFNLGIYFFLSLTIQTRNSRDLHNDDTIITLSAGRDTPKLVAAVVTFCWLWTSLIVLGVGVTKGVVRKGWKHYNCRLRVQILLTWAMLDILAGLGWVRTGGSPKSVRKHWDR